MCRDKTEYRPTDSLDKKSSSSVEATLVRGSATLKATTVEPIQRPAIGMGFPYRASYIVTAPRVVQSSHFLLEADPWEMIAGSPRDPHRRSLPRAARWTACSYVPIGKFGRWLVDRVASRSKGLMLYRHIPTRLLFSIAQPSETPTGRGAILTTASPSDRG